MSGTVSIGKRNVDDTKATKTVLASTLRHASEESSSRRLSIGLEQAEENAASSSQQQPLARSWKPLC
jgi:hypothetical protein